MTRNCPQCGHANLTSADECLKCHVALSPAAHGESADDYPDRSPLPWVIGGIVFICVAGLAYSGQNRAAPMARPAAIETVSEPPPEAPEAPPPLAVVASGPAPAIPGAAPSHQGEWQAVAVFQGRGHHRTRSFAIRSLNWRVRWATTSQDNHEWYGPGSDFKAGIHRKIGEQVAEIANGQGQYSGVSRLSGQGTFYADVYAAGNWTISAEEWR